MSGVTVGFDLDLAISSLRKFFGGFSVNLTELRRKYCGEGGPYIIRDEPGIERIFADLYFVPREIKRDYYRVKALELLLYLDALRLSEAGEERPYFYKSQVEKIKAIHRLITEDLQTRYTLEELADRFSVSLTAMKKCFKAIYGDSIYAYLRRFRMNAAATALRREPEIAGLVGYESPSKFSAAFHQIMGQTPAEYRKSFF